MRFPVGIKGKKVALSDRFWEKVDKNCSPVRDLGPCWEWIGAVRSNGYGVIRGDNGRTLRAHRVSYEMTVGPIPDGLDLRHHCDNRRCVNPAHLAPGTRLENMRDAVERGRTRRRKSSAVQVNETQQF